MSAPRLLGRRPRRTVPIDRLGPMDRPSGMVLGRERWRDVLWLHWPIPAKDLRPHVPGRLELDRFDGKAWVSVVALGLEDVRPPLAPFGISFQEVNVRTYVHRDGKEPGIFLLSVDVDSLVAGAAMWLAQGLPVRNSRIEHRHEDGRLEWRVDHEEAHLRAACQLGGRDGASEPGTLDHFLLERYFVHSMRGGTLWTTRIHHDPLDRERARILELHERLVGPLGLPEREGAPHVHFARHADVEIFLPQIRL